MRNYGSVHTRFWSNPEILKLSDQAKLLGLYLLTGPHTNMLGCFRLPLGYICEDLKWGCETVSQRLAELQAISFATYDLAQGWVFIHRFLEWNSIENPNQGKSIRRLFEQVPPITLFFSRLVATLLIHEKYLEQPFKGCLQTLSKPFRNQEQEQDQEQEQELEEMLNSISLSGKPDAAPLNFENNPPNAITELVKPSLLKAQAMEVLQFLNEKTGRTYRSVETNLKLIVARLKSGTTVMDCRQVIAKKTRDWKDDPKMVSYLRPATLFNATKFEQYLGELLPEEGAP